MADRQAVHQRIAQTLLNDFPEVVATQPELLAQHWAAAGEIPQAIEYWSKAGQRAIRNSANLEAIEHFNNGLQLLMTLPVDQDRNKTEFTMLASLCPVLYAAKGYGSEDAAQTNVRISALSGLVGDSPDLFLANWVFVMNSIANPDFLKSEALKLAMRMLNLTHDDPLRKQVAHFAIADAAFWLGEFETSHSHAEQALALYHPSQRQNLMERSVKTYPCLARPICVGRYIFLATRIGRNRLTWASSHRHVSWPTRKTSGLPCVSLRCYIAG